MTKAKKDKLDAAPIAIQCLEANNMCLPESINKVLHIHVALKNDLGQLTKRVNELKSKIEMLPRKQPVLNADTDISQIQDKVDNLENSSRRANMFSGIKSGDAFEPWMSSVLYK